MIVIYAEINLRNNIEELAKSVLKPFILKKYQKKTLPTEQEVHEMKVQQYIHRVDNNADDNSTKRQVVHPINLESIIRSRDVSKLKSVTHN